MSGSGPRPLVPDARSAPGFARSGFQQDYFTLFGLERRFGIDEAALDAAYHALQSRVHPDRHAHLPETERRLSMQWAARVNEAYRALKKPLSRALYLLQLQGLDAHVESNTAMPSEFLMEQMEWRESVAEARARNDTDELDALMRELRGQRSALVGEIQSAFDGRHDYDGAARLVLRLMFMEKLEQDIDLALEALEA